MHVRIFAALPFCVGIPLTTLPVVLNIVNYVQDQNCSFILMNKLQTDPIDCDLCLNE